MNESIGIEISKINLNFYSYKDDDFLNGNNFEYVRKYGRKYLFFCS